MVKLISINGLKRVVKKLNDDTMELRGNSMMRISDVSQAFLESLEEQEGRF